MTASKPIPRIFERQVSVRCVFLLFPLSLIRLQERMPYIPRKICVDFLTAWLVLIPRQMHACMRSVKNPCGFSYSVVRAYFKINACMHTFRRKSEIIFVQRRVFLLQDNCMHACMHPYIPRKVSEDFCTAWCMLILR